MSHILTRRAFGLLLSMILLGFLTTNSRANHEHEWVRNVIGALQAVSDESGLELFQLHVIRGDTDSVKGLAVLTRSISENASTHSAIIIKGVERGGRFWPYLRGEVTNDFREGWREVEMPKPTGKQATRSVKPQTLGETLFVDLSAFRRHNARERYGRVILPDGESATFLLNNLRPAKDVVHSWSRGRMDDADLHPSAYEETFLLPAAEREEPHSLGMLAIEGNNGVIVGRFDFRPANERPAQEEEVDEPKEPIWPHATLQVANDYRLGWETIGEVSNPAKITELQGRPQFGTKLNVYLNSLRPMIGRFRWGRVVLSTGDFAIFELRDLLPPDNK